MTTLSVSRYVHPKRWIQYDPSAIFDALVEAKASAAVLSQLPYLSQWVEQVLEEQLRLEAAGTSRIEGAEFNEQEQADALTPDIPSHVILNHSQRQLRAADATYRWLRTLPADRPVDRQFVLDVHRRMVTCCDDDHCEPGALRRSSQNVTFGTPRCRGVEGGDDCQSAFGDLCEAIVGEFQGHDRIIQAIAAHYHIGAMHPFEDGNGRTARAVEAFMMRHAGVNSIVMVSLSNYYNDHRDEYLAVLQESRRRAHDLTPFLRFALRAVATQCNNVAQQIIKNHRRTLFREFSRSLFGQLRSPRRRVLADRQLQTLDLLLDEGPLDILEVLRRTRANYSNLKFPMRAQIRDLAWLLTLESVEMQDGLISINLEWPQRASETVMLDVMEQLRSAKSASHPAMADLSRLLGRRDSG